MRNLVRLDPNLRRARWVAHLDLLGTSERIRNENWENVFSAYSSALDALREESFDEERVERVVFSDSFLIYSRDDSSLDYRAIDSLCRHFVIRLIQRELPVRGAVSCLDLYADKAASLYFGNGLLESHEVGESTDWIGLVLAPSARARLAEVNLPVEERLNYAVWPVPITQQPFSSGATQELAAFIMAASPNRQNVQRTIEVLRRMSSSAGADSVRKKYENSIRFLEANVREPSAA